MLSAAFLLCMACVPMAVPGTRVEREPGARSAGEEPSDNLVIRLSGRTESTQRLEPPSIESLPSEAADRMMSGLPELPSSGKEPFKLPAPSLVPPPPGEVVATTFSADRGADAGPAPEIASDTPLRIQRAAPVGEVEIAERVSIRFSQPMVPLATPEDLSPDQVPARLEPQVPGHWRWLDPQTLDFEPDTRLPMATEYRLEVPAGIASLTGEILQEPFRAEFQTPAPRLIGRSPESGSGRESGGDPVVLLEFDQRIDPAAVARLVELRAGRARIGIRMATPEEIQADEGVRTRIESAREAGREGRWLALRPTRTLPDDMQIDVRLPAGVPSAEGLVRTTAEQAWSFRTAGPLRVKKVTCGYSSDSKCSPGDPFLIELSNPLEKATCDERSLEITPPIDDAYVSCSRSSIFVSGGKQPRTTYQLTLSADLRDVFGHRLGAPSLHELRVNDETARLLGPSGMVVKDPSEPLIVSSRNYRELRVRTFDVAPSDWESFSRFSSRVRLLGGRPVQEAPSQIPPWPLLQDRTISVESLPNAWTTTRIPLDGNRRHQVTLVEPVTHGSTDSTQPALLSWVQHTSIGLQVLYDDDQMLVFASSLVDGAPLAGVELAIAKERATTDASGLARISAPTPDAREISESTAAAAAAAAFARSTTSALVLRGSLRGETVLFQVSPEFLLRTRPSSATPELRWFILDDRLVYRPGETVHIKGFVRRIEPDASANLAAVDELFPKIDFEVSQESGSAPVELARGDARITEAGSFSFSFEIPVSSPTGYGRIRIQPRGGSVERYQRGEHYFVISEYRRSELAASIRATPGPYVIGDSATLTAQASYRSGEVVRNSPIRWRVVAYPSDFVPPGHQGFSFSSESNTRGSLGRLRRDAGEQMYTGQTDGDGQHALRVDLLSLERPYPTELFAFASVMDVTHREVTSQTSLVVHPSKAYAGLRLARPPRLRAAYTPGEPILVDAIATDLAGELLEGTAVDLHFERFQRRSQRAERSTRETGSTVRDPEWSEIDAQSCSVRMGKAPVQCAFTAPETGWYRIRAVVRDDEGRPNESYVEVIATDPSPGPASERAGQVILTPDRSEYAPGDVARIALEAPFAPAEALVSMRRHGILETRRLRLSTPSYSVAIPITEEHVMGLDVRVDLVAASPMSDEDAGLRSKPAPSVPSDAAPATERNSGARTSAFVAGRSYAEGQVRLEVPSRFRTLQVSVEPKPRVVAPGSSAELTVDVRDSAGVPVADSEVTVLVVDEATLDRSKRSYPDPIATFYRPFYPAVFDATLRSLIQTGEIDPELARPSVLRASAVSTALSIAGDGLDLRSEFTPLAAFVPDLHTNAKGRVKTGITLPDTLTQYRVLVLAAAGALEFGKAESSLRTRRDLTVRPSPPRFVRVGDRFELPLVVQNTGDEPTMVDVALRSRELEFPEGRARRVTVPARDRVELRIPAEAPSPGNATFDARVLSSGASDAMRLSLPVYTPATPEAFAAYGDLEAGSIRQDVELPPSIRTDFGGLDISTSSTQLQSLSDAVMYLVEYPFECAEQRASRLIALTRPRALLDALSAAGLPSAGERERIVAEQLGELAKLQREDGGFMLWPSSRESDPYVSVHVMHALARAREAGFEVPKELVDKGLPYLRSLPFPAKYPPSNQVAVRAYALRVRALFHDSRTNDVRSLIRGEGGVDRLPTEALGWLLSAAAADPELVGEIASMQRRLLNLVTETADAARFRQSYSDGAYLILHSARRTDAIVLEALLATQPTNDLVPKLVRGLLGGRRRGRWASTQENVFALLALTRYFELYESTPPAFVARTWLGDTLAAEESFEGRQASTRQLSIPMDVLNAMDVLNTMDILNATEVPSAMDVPDEGSQVTPARRLPITLSHSGRGRLYYRIGLRSVPKTVELAAKERGFAISRTYEAIDAPDDVRRDDDGTWHLCAGARVRVHVTVVAEAARNHVAVVSPLPAGLEPIDPLLAGNEPPSFLRPTAPALRRSSWRWFEHENLRDDRAEIFATQLQGGIYAYTHMARATTIGSFVAPPAYAEQMYSPETFGRSSSDRVVIDPIDPSGSASAE